MQVTDFSWPQGDAAIGPSLRPIGEAADGTGFDTIWVMGHVSLLLSDSITWFPTGRVAPGPTRSVLMNRFRAQGLVRASKFVYTEHHTSVD